MITFAFNTTVNTIFNFADILIETETASDALGRGDYLQFGKGIGKLASDLFIKNPINTFGWRFKNS